MKRWWYGYNLGIYKFNWWVKRKLGNESMHDREMWEKLSPLLYLLLGIVITALSIYTYQVFMKGNV